MFKVIRKNQKIFGAVFGVILMVMFLSQLGPQGGQRTASPLLRTVATVGGEKVTQLQLNIANEEWQVLKGLRVAGPPSQNGETYPLAFGLLPQQVFTLIEQNQKAGQNSPLFFLLYKEAERHGIYVDERDEGVQTQINNNVLGMPQQGADDYQISVDAIVHCLEIQRLANSVDSFVKISRPIRRFDMARMAQLLRVKVSPILASSYLDKIPPPTDADIQKQFDAFKDRLAGQFGQPGNPLGFGYEVPNRVQLQYIGLNHADLRQAAIASKSKEDWYVAAYGVFKDHRDDYDSRPVAPSTQPTQVAGPNKPGSATQPESDIRKLDNLDDDFALHAELVLDDLYDQETDTLQSNILKQITEKMNTGYGLYRDALAAGGGKAPTGTPADYVSDQFLHDVAASAQSQFGVTPIVGDIKQFKSADELTQLSGIGQSSYGLASTNKRLAFAAYATELFQPWMADSAKNSPAASLAIVLWQFSNTLEDPEQNVYIFRITGSDPAHAPVLSDMKDRVAADWKAAAAYEKALEAGRALLAGAQLHGLDQAASQAKLSSPILTESFDPIVLAEEEQSGISIPPLVLQHYSVLQLGAAAQQLIVTPSGANHRPQGLAELYADRIVSVIELYEAKPSWNADEEPFLAMRTAELAASQTRGPLLSTLFTPQAVSDRLNYQVIPEPKGSQ